MRETLFNNKNIETFYGIKFSYTYIFNFTGETETDDKWKSIPGFSTGSKQSNPNQLRSSGIGLGFY